MTSSTVLRQSCLSLVWADSSRGASNSINASSALFSVSFSPVLVLNSFCPACVDHQRALLPSHFPSLLPLLSWRHCCIALASPVLVWRHRPLALASLTLSSYLHCRHCYRCCNTPISLPLLPMHVPCIGPALSCHPCWCWCQRHNSKPLASTMLTPMPSSHVLLPLPPLNTAAAIFNRCPMPLPNATAPPPSSKAIVMAIFQCHFHPWWLLCAHFIPQNARVYFIAPCDWEFSQRCTVNNLWKTNFGSGKIIFVCRSN